MAKRRTPPDRASSNEGLAVVNARLQKKVQDLEAANKDLSQLLKSGGGACAPPEDGNWVRRLQEQAEFLQNVLESISHPLYVINADDYSIEMANSAARAMQGFGEGTCHALIHGDLPCSRKGIPCPLEIARITGKPSTVQHLGRDEDGNLRWLEVQGFPIIKNGKVVQIIEYAFDISERKRHERRIMRARELAETANRMKSSFLAAVSHDLRTPLNAILGYSEAMITGAVKADFDERCREYFQSIQVAGLHLLNLINDVLDLSAAQSEKFTLFEEPIVPAAVAASCLRLVNGMAAKAGVTLEARIGDDLPKLFADDRRVKQILVNLLGNAIKFSPRDGIVILTGRVDRLNRLSFEVVDHGIGMGSDQIEAALEPFSHIDSMSFRSKEGTGLGLPLAKRMVEAHGGTLKIRSRPGKGTTVVVRFPKLRTIADA